MCLLNLTHYTKARSELDLHERPRHIPWLPSVSLGHSIIGGASDPRVHKWEGFTSTAGAADADDCAHADG